MKIHLNPLLLGAFIIGAVAILISGLLGLGTLDFFHPTSHFIFYLPGSSQEIGEGATVSLDGVPVGQVESVRVFFDSDTKKSFVGLTCQIKKDLLTDIHGRPIKLTDTGVLRNLISQGLFVQVQSMSLIGTKFVELGFQSATPPIALADLPQSPYPVVPSVPATMSEAAESVAKIISNLKQIDFQGILQQANGLLVSARGQIDELQTNRLTDHVSAAADSFGNFMNSPDLRRAVVRLQGAASNLQDLMTNLDTQIGPLGTNLDATLASATQSAQAVQDFLTLHNQLGEQTQELLQQLDETARSIEDLSDFLQRHPNALITGRAKRPKQP